MRQRTGKKVKGIHSTEPLKEKQMALRSHIRRTDNSKIGRQILNNRASQVKEVTSAPPADAPVVASAPVEKKASTSKKKTSKKTDKD